MIFLTRNFVILYVIALHVRTGRTWVLQPSVGGTDTSKACDLPNFQCRNSLVCISGTWVCDGRPDCPQNDDEENCDREENGEVCADNDVNFLPGCTYKEYYNKIWLCTILFFDDYPYQNATTCSNQLRLFNRCNRGVLKQCLIGNKPGLAGPNSPFSTETFTNTLMNSNLVLTPTRELFCEQSEERSNELYQLLTNSSSALNSFCNNRILPGLLNSFASVLRNIINADDSVEFCRLYSNYTSLSADLLRSCDFEALLSGIPLFNEQSLNLRKLFQVSEELLSESFIPKCLALQEPEDPMISETTPVTTTDSTEGNGCSSYNLDLMFLVDGSGSVDVREFIEQMNFVENIVSSLNLTRHRVGVMKYSYYLPGRPWTDQPFLVTEIELGEFDNQLEFAMAADSIEPQPYIGFPAYAIDKAVSIDLPSSDRFNDSCTHKVIIVITDGRSSDPEYLSQVTSSARELGIIFFAVGVDNFGIDELQIIASGVVGNNERIYSTETFFDLEDIGDRLRYDLAMLLVV